MGSLAQDAPTMPLAAFGQLRDDAKRGLHNRNGRGLDYEKSEQYGSSEAAAQGGQR